MLHKRRECRLRECRLRECRLRERDEHRRQYWRHTLEQIELLLCESALRLRKRSVRLIRLRLRALCLRCEPSLLLLELWHERLATLELLFLGLDACACFGERGERRRVLAPQTLERQALAVQNRLELLLAFAPEESGAKPRLMVRIEETMGVDQWGGGGGSSREQWGLINAG